MPDHMLHSLCILIIRYIRWPHGNPYGHSGSFPQSAGKLHLSSHISYNMLHQRKPQPAASVFFIITDKVLKDRPLKFFFHTGSVICKTHGYHLPSGLHQLRIDLTPGIATVFPILNGILHTIDNDLFPSYRIQHYQWKICRFYFKYNLDFLFTCLFFQFIGNFTNQLPRCNRLFYDSHVIRLSRWDIQQISEYRLQLLHIFHCFPDICPAVISCLFQLQLLQNTGQLIKWCPDIFWNM